MNMWNPWSSTWTEYTKSLWRFCKRVWVELCANLKYTPWSSPLKINWTWHWNVHCLGVLTHFQEGLCCKYESPKMNEVKSNNLSTPLAVQHANLMVDLQHPALPSWDTNIVIHQLSLGSLVSLHFMFTSAHNMSRTDATREVLKAMLLTWDLSEICSYSTSSSHWSRTQPLVTNPVIAMHHLTLPVNHCQSQIFKCETACCPPASAVAAKSEDILSFHTSQQVQTILSK